MSRIADAYGTNGGINFTIYTRDRSHCRRVIVTIVGHIVRSDYDARIGFVGGAWSGGRWDVFVVGSTSEAPRIGRIGAGISMLRIAHVNGTDSRTRLAIHTDNGCNG